VNGKRLGALAASAAVMTALAVLLYSGASEPPEFIGGEHLLKGLDPARIARIVVKKGEDVVTLTATEGGFVVVEKSGYPAAMKVVNELFYKCTMIRCRERATASPENHAGLGVVEGAEEAVSVTFLDAANKPIVGLLRGKGAEGGGSYVRRTSGKDPDTVYVSTEYIDIRTGPTDYLETKLVDIAREEIVSVRVEVGGKSYEISRGAGDAGDAGSARVLRAGPAGRRAKAGEIERVFGALAGLWLADLEREAAAGLTWEADYACRMKTGLVYTARLARRGEDDFLALAATPPSLVGVQITGDESEEELKEKDALIKARSRAQRFSQRHQGWVYKVSNWDARDLRRPLAELLEDIPAAETPEAPEAPKMPKAPRATGSPEAPAGADI